MNYLKIKRNKKERCDANANTKQVQCVLEIGMEFESQEKECLSCSSLPTVRRRLQFSGMLKVQDQDHRGTISRQISVFQNEKM